MTFFRCHNFFSVFSPSLFSALFSRLDLFTEKIPNASQISTCFFKLVTMKIQKFRGSIRL